jgi:hypothetical protein
MKLDLNYDLHDQDFADPRDYEGTPGDIDVDDYDYKVERDLGVTEDFGDEAYEAERARDILEYEAAEQAMFDRLMEGFNETDHPATGHGLFDRLMAEDPL